MIDHKPVISGTKMPKLLKIRSTKIHNMPLSANSIEDDDSVTSRNLSENLPESVVSSSCLRRSGRAHRGKSALELLGIASKETRKSSTDAKQITRNISAVVRDQRFIKPDAKEKDDRGHRAVEKQQSSNGSFQSEGSLQGDQRSVENDRCLELLKDCRTEEIRSQDGIQGQPNEKVQSEEGSQSQCIGNDLRSKDDDTNDQSHGEELVVFLKEHSKVEGGGSSRVIDRSQATTITSSKVSTLAESFKGSLSTASRKVITVSRRVESSSDKEVTKGLSEQATKVFCNNSNDFHKTKLTGTSLENKAVFDTDYREKCKVAEVSGKETMPVPCCKSTDSLLDSKSVSETDSQKLLESNAIEQALQPVHELQQQSTELEVVAHGNRTKSSMSSVVRKVAPNRKRCGRKADDNHLEPCTSDDLSNLLRNEKGRALPVRQLVMGRDLRDLIENLEPQDRMDDHVVTSKMSGKRSVMRCKYCNTVIRNQHEFRRHVKTHAEANYNPFHCPYCDYKAQIRAQIARHINIHSTKKAYVCKECGRGFNFKQKLQIHMKYHEDVRDHSCPLCQLSFHEFKTLKNHLLKIHQADNVDEIIPRKRNPVKHLSAAKELPPSNEAKKISDHVIIANKASKDKTSSGENLLMVCDENTNQALDPVEVFVFDGVEYRAGAYVSVNDPSTFETLNGLPESGVRLIEFLRNLDPTSEVVEVKKEIGGELEITPSIIFNSSNALSRSSDAVQVMFEGNRSVVLRVSKAPESSGDARKDEKLQSASGKKTRVRRRGIIGTRKTILQTKKFRMAQEGATELNSPPQKTKTSQRDRTRVQLFGGPPSKRFVNNQRVVAASEVSSELKEYCDVFNDHPDFPDFKVIFICKVCAPDRPAFPSKTQFATHLEVAHPDVKAWTCQFCDYRCRLRTSLIVHSKMHSTRGSHICELCGEAFVFKQKLLSHIRQHLNKRDFVCAVCSKAFNEPSHLRKHVKTVHCDERPCKCEVCGKKFKKAMNLRRHMEVHTTTQKFQCEFCNKLYKTQTSLLQHAKSHKCIFHCEICNRNFGSYSGFMAHKVMHDESLTGYSCCVCHKVLHTKGSLQRHTTMVHTSVRAFKCELCQKSFKSKKDLQMHKFVHTSEKNFVCNLCGFECKRATSLSVHWRRHYAVKPFQCSVCNKQYTQKQSLETHLGKHCCFDQIDCRLCGKTCNGSLGLKRHLQVEHGGRHVSDLDVDASTKSSLVDLGFMYACEECNNVFSTQENLAGHILSEHMKPSVQSEIRSTRELQEAPEAVVHFEVSTDTAGVPIAAGSNQLQLVGTEVQSDMIHSLVKIEDPLTGVDKIVSILIPRDNSVVVGRNLSSAELNIKREMEFPVMENSVPAAEDVVLNSDSHESSILHASETVEYDPLPTTDYGGAMVTEKSTSGGQVTYVMIDKSNVSGFHAGSLVSGNAGTLAGAE